MSDDQKTVLVAESDSRVLDALASQFKKRGMLTITAEDGFDAYTRACKESPDFLIAEINIPLVNGYRLSKLLKGDERYRHLIIILMTTKIINKSEEMYQASEANDIIQKPFRFQSLFDLINVPVSL